MHELGSARVRGAGGSVAIIYELHPDRLVVEVVDEGGGSTRRVARSMPPTSDDELSVGGLGLAIIDAISRRVRDRRAGGRRLHAALRQAAQADAWRRDATLGAGR